MTDPAGTPKVWTVVELLRWTTQYLDTRGFHNARLNGEHLLAGTLGLKRLDLYLQFDRPLQPPELSEFKARLLRRAKREPLQYIDGVAHFRDLVLRVDRRVLIPRPETELLVTGVLRWAAGRAGLHVADVGTGSGAIALSLASEGTFERVVATDVDAAALEVARANHAAVAPAVPVEFRLGDGLSPLLGERFDAVVSNPPYIADAERSSLDAEVRDWEPERALFAGADGLSLIRELAAGAPEVLRPGGLLALEIGAEQGAAAAEVIRAVPGLCEPRVRPDLAGRDRFIFAEMEG